VAGFRNWQELGRQVRKGERAIKILGCSTKKITKTDPDIGDEVEDRLTRCPVLSVFDVSQTDGDPIPVDLRTSCPPAMIRTAHWIVSLCG
jgi:antirestriction protein ArdC